MKELEQVESINRDNVKSIRHALKVLNDAAKDSSAEIKEMINQDFSRVKEAFADLKPEVRGAVHELREASEESVMRMKDRIIDTSRVATKRIDQSVHEHPWYFIGAAAALAAVFGFLLERRRH